MMRGRLSTHNFKRLLLTVSGLSICAVLFFSAQRLLMPKYMSDVYEGAMTAEFYAENLPCDVLILGDCEVYEGVSPVTLWENYGIASYIRGGPQQLLWHSYYLLEDALRYAKPRAVVLNVSAAQYGTPRREVYNRLNIDGMKLSVSKLKAARASLTEGESVLSYAFPLLRYHDRWSALTGDDFAYFFNAGKVAVSGYMLNCGVMPAGYIPGVNPLPDYRLNANSLMYLEKTLKLCADNGIELILFKAPALYPHWYDEWDAQIAEFAERNGLMYINCLNAAEEIGFDYDTDYYIAGQHINVYGAEKIADYLGGFLAAHAPDRRGDAAYAAEWGEKVSMYNWLKDTQRRELAENGKISTYIYRDY